MIQWFNREEAGKPDQKTISPEILKEEAT